MRDALPKSGGFCPEGLVGLAPDHHGLGGPAAAGAHIAQVLLRKGHAPAGKPGLGFHLFLTGHIAAPHGLDKAALGGAQFLDLVQGMGGISMRFPVLEGVLVQAVGQFLQQVGMAVSSSSRLTKGLFPVIPAHQYALVLFHILGADLQAQGHALHLHC